MSKVISHKKFTRASKLAVPALATLMYTPVVMAEVYGFYRGLDAQINASSDIVVVKLWEAPPIFNPVYDPTNGTASGVINGYDVEIIGVIKGNHTAGTTMTMGLGSFGGPVPTKHYTMWEKKPQLVPSGPLQFRTNYLVFLNMPARTLNRTGNMLKVTGNKPYSRKPGEPVEAAITRLTGLKY